MKKYEIIFYRESLIQSLLADFGTFSFLLGGAWFNYHMIGNSKFINAILLIMFLFFLIVKGGPRKHVFTSKEDLIKYLKGKQ